MSLQLNLHILIRFSRFSQTILRVTAELCLSRDMAQTVYSVRGKNFVEKLSIERENELRCILDGWLSLTEMSSDTQD